MNLGEKILKLRKDKKLSQEQLAEKVDVTRQTISNWELGETSPNPDQLKTLSKVLNVSIDELLDNDVKEVLVEKVSNTEKLAGIIIKGLKILGIIFIALLVINIIAFILFNVNIKKTTESYTENIEMVCTIENKNYIISVGNDGYFNCSNCDKNIQKDLKNNSIDYSDLDKTSENISNYFKNKNGSCE